MSGNSVANCVPGTPRAGNEGSELRFNLVKLTGEFVWHYHDREDEMVAAFDYCLHGRGRVEALSTAEAPSAPAEAVARCNSLLST